MREKVVTMRKGDQVQLTDQKSSIVGVDTVDKPLNRRSVGQFDRETSFAESL